ncbi:hypothetical protein CAEBREN_22849 [Caenorhabditis brenneri]|uniref:Uncharacterized protein n=1 Tax=Caenorhabditis brenneri TaxID=135651 RepID=G0P3L6_CAEBE|nr:hypothetical protein CAEBREN_22849 [Caenorhabditis brenneri]
MKKMMATSNCLFFHFSYTPIVVFGWFSRDTNISRIDINPSFAYRKLQPHFSSCELGITPVPRSNLPNLSHEGSPKPFP